MLEHVSYNKTSVRELERQIALRIQAMPALKMRESTLRHEFRVLNSELKALEPELQKLHKQLETFHPLLIELHPDDMLSLLPVVVRERVAGIRIPVLKLIENFRPTEKPIYEPFWLRFARPLLLRLEELTIKIEVLQTGAERLDRARKRITRKINLFEKVQIPEMDKRIMEIKRYMEDAEALNAAAQKLSRRHALEEAAIDD